MNAEANDPACVLIHDHQGPVGPHRSRFAPEQIQVTLPFDNGLAKFMALTIHWPHAVEFLGNTRAIRMEGRAGSKPVSLLKLLEERSRTLKGQQEKAGAVWVEYLKIESSRQFLSHGELLSEIEGCGLR
jgi:hypothetical protein